MNIILYLPKKTIIYRKKGLQGCTIKTFLQEIKIIPQYKL